jgi:hypothetical protein
MRYTLTTNEGGSWQMDGHALSYMLEQYAKHGVPCTVTDLDGKVCGGVYYESSGGTYHWNIKLQGVARKESDE